jgi:hypothetical protein
MLVSGTRHVSNLVAWASRSTVMTNLLERDLALGRGDFREERREWLHQVEEAYWMAHGLAPELE